MKKKTAINNVYAHKQEALNNVTNAHSNSEMLKCTTRWYKHYQSRST